MKKSCCTLIFAVVAIFCFAQNGYKKVYKYGAYNRDWALVKDITGNYGFIDSDGKEVVPTNYKKIGKFNKTVHNYALVKDVLGYYGLIDCYGKEVSAMHEDDSEDEE